MPFSEKNRNENNLSLFIVQPRTCSFTMQQMELENWQQLSPVHYVLHLPDAAAVQTCWDTSIASEIWKIKALNTWPIIFEVQLIISAGDARCLVGNLYTTQQYQVAILPHCSSIFFFWTKYQILTGTLPGCKFTEQSSCLSGHPARENLDNGIKCQNLVRLY